MDNIVVIGASGAIGNALADKAQARFPDAQLHRLNRSDNSIDLLDEASIEQAISTAARDLPIDLAVIATGILHDDQAQPEKSMRELNADQMAHLFAINTIGPALCLKHLAPRLRRKGDARIGVLSARVGSISDNQLGGWFSYRASKAALNMIVKSASIEVQRRNPEAVIVGLHPGTVDSGLSQPFQKAVPDGKLFKPQKAGHDLMDVLLSRRADQSGRCFDYAGLEITP